MLKTVMLIAGLALSACSGSFIARAQGTAFTYQGRLNDGNAPANGIYDFTFALYATNFSGGAIAGPITNS